MAAAPEKQPAARPPAGSWQGGLAWRRVPGTATTTRGSRRPSSTPSINLTDLLAGSVARFPDKPALLYFGRPLTFRELDTLSDRLAAALQEMGVVKGDRVTRVPPQLPPDGHRLRGHLEGGGRGRAFQPPVHGRGVRPSDGRRRQPGRLLPDPQLPPGAPGPAPDRSGARHRHQRQGVLPAPPAGPVHRGQGEEGRAPGRLLERPQHLLAARGDRRRRRRSRSRCPSTRATWPS